METDRLTFLGAQVDLDRRVAPRVEDLARVDALDHNHDAASCKTQDSKTQNSGCRILESGNGPQDCMANCATPQREEHFAML